MPDEHTSNAFGDMPRQDVSVTNAAQQKRYEISLDGDLVGFTQYLDRGGQRIFFHTEIDEAFTGRGLAGILISNALTDARSASMRIVAVCPFVVKYLEKHHDFDDITDPVTPDALTAVRGGNA